MVDNHQVRMVLRDLPLLVSDFAGRMLAYPILGNCHEIFTYADKERDVEALCNSITFVAAADVRSQIEKECDEVMDFITILYNELVNSILSVLPEAHGLKNRYLLNHEQTAFEVAKGTSVLKQYLSPIFSQLHELSNVQNLLINQLPQFKALGSKGFDFSQVVDSFINGVITLGAPWLGIGRQISGSIANSKQYDNQKQFLKVFESNYNNYLSRWNSLRNTYYPSIWEKQKSFVHEKIENIIDVSIPSVLSDLHREGFHSNAIIPALQKVCNELNDEYKRSCG